MKSRRSIAIASLIVLMIMWGSTFVATKAAAREIAPLTLATLRFFIAALILVPLACARGSFRKLPRPVPWRSLWLMAFTGVSAFAVTFTYALTHGSAAQGALIYAALPAAIAVAAVVFLREKLSTRRLSGVALSVLGVALLIAAGERGADSPHPVLGALWMLGAVVSWTAYTVFAKRLADVDFLATIAVVSALGTAMLLPLGMIELGNHPWSNPSATTWLNVLFLGVIASALAYLVYGYVLSELDASLVGVYTNLDPIVGVIIAVAWFGEVLHPVQIAGGAIALTGMWLASAQR